jgi:hypothetical protein
LKNNRALVRETRRAAFAVGFRNLTARFEKTRSANGNRFSSGDANGHARVSRISSKQAFPI